MISFLCSEYLILSKWIQSLYSTSVYFLAADPISDEIHTDEQAITDSWEKLCQFTGTSLYQEGLNFCIEIKRI